jgi:hypothetical protein
MPPLTRSAPLAAIAAVALAVAGCGSSSEQGATTSAARTTSAANAALDRRVASAEAAAKATPRSVQALADLAEAHYLAAGADTDPADTNYGPVGRAHLRAAAEAWERLLALKPERPDVAVASMMALAYGETGLGEPRKAIAAQVVVTERRKDASSYEQLARMAYAAGDLRTGDLAAGRAVKLTPAGDRARIRDGLRELRAERPPGTG